MDYQQRETNLIKLARALYECAVHEENVERLELLRHVAVEAAGLFGDSYNEDSILHPDLGLELLLFIKLKASNEPEAETDRLEVSRIIEKIENDLHIQHNS